MAVPIALSPKNPESPAEIESRLDEARIVHAKAVLSAYELLQELHDARVLDFLRGALGAGDTIVTKLAVASGSEPPINAVRNVISLAKIVAAIDPDFLHDLAEDLTRQKAKAMPAPKPSLWRAVRIFTSADSRRALIGGAAFLQAFGRALRRAKHNSI